MKHIFLFAPPTIVELNGETKLLDLQQKETKKAEPFIDSAFTIFKPTEAYSPGPQSGK